MPLSFQLSTATIIDPNPNPKPHPNNCFLISAIDFTLSGNNWQNQKTAYENWKFSV